MQLLVVGSILMKMLISSPVLCYMPYIPTGVYNLRFDLGIQHIATPRLLHLSSSSNKHVNDDHQDESTLKRDRDEIEQDQVNAILIIIDPLIAL